MITLLRKISWALLLFSLSAWVAFAWFTQPFTAEFLEYSLLEQRFLTIMLVSIMASLWVYTAAQAAEAVRDIVSLNKPRGV